MRPPAARWYSTASWQLGVVVRPTSMTSHPTDCSAAMTARWNIGPETRESRPTTIARPLARLAAHAPNAAANRPTTSGVSASPTRPRKPDTLIINPSYTSSPGAVGAKATGAHVAHQARVTRGTGGAFYECRQLVDSLVRHSMAAVPEAPPVLVVQLGGVAATLPPQDGRAHRRRRHRDARTRPHAHLLQGARAAHDAECHAPHSHRAQRGRRHSVRFD